MNRLKLFVPLLVFLVIGAFFYVTMARISDGEYNPQALPSALLNKPVPQFTLPTVENMDRRVSDQDLRGEIALVNVWATWCPSCHIEHGFLNTLAESGVLIFGVNYKDELDLAQNWLSKKGNPYRFNMFDVQGRLGLDLGVTGAPETYLIDHRGFVRYRYQGPLDDRVWNQEFVPRIEGLRREQEGAEG